MDLVLLEQLREKYLEKVKENNEKISLREELEQLKENKDVKRYLELINMGEIFVYSDEELIKIIFNKRKINRTIDCNIYVYYGAYYKRNTNIYLDGELTCDRKLSDYVLYKGLIDVYDIHQVNPHNHEFIKDKITIIFNEEKIITMKDYDKLYDVLRTFYCKRILDGLNEKEILDEIIKNKDEFNIRLVVYDEKVQSNIKKLKKGSS